jgi:hypothetical protein
MITNPPNLAKLILTEGVNNVAKRYNKSPAIMASDLAHLAIYNERHIKKLESENKELRTNLEKAKAEILTLSRKDISAKAGRKLSYKKLEHRGLFTPIKIKGKVYYAADEVEEFFKTVKLTKLPKDVYDTHAGKDDDFIALIDLAKTWDVTYMGLKSACIRLGINIVIHRDRVGIHEDDIDTLADGFNTEHSDKRKGKRGGYGRPPYGGRAVEVIDNTIAASHHITVNKGGTVIIAESVTIQA